jgi:hypothetical protein
MSSAIMGPFIRGLKGIDTFQLRGMFQSLAYTWSLRCRPTAEAGTSISTSCAYNLPSSNECKRRKIKCNGNTPCQRCGNLNLECQYAPNCCTNGFKESEEFRQMNAQISSLQEQVDSLYASLNALRSDGMSFRPSSERSNSTSHSPFVRRISQPKHPAFRGPTSSAFSLDVAKNTLQKMGYQSLSEDVMTEDPSPIGTPPIMMPPSIINANGNQRDPIWALSKEEVVRLCRVYEEEMGLMYPVLNIEDIITHGKNLVSSLKKSIKPPTNFRYA